MRPPPPRPVSRRSPLNDPRIQGSGVLMEASLPGLRGRPIVLGLLVAVGVVALDQAVKLWLLFILNLELLERQAVEKAMRLSEGNITRAAEYLGITRFALYRKLEKLGL